MQTGESPQYFDSGVAKDAPSPTGCVLIVDDERPLRRGLRRMVEQAGHNALEAGSIAEARTQLQTGCVDVVMLDLLLPDASGLSLLGDAALSARDIAVIVFTASRARSDMRASLAGGAASYLHKSADPLTVEAQIETALRGVETNRRARAERRRMEASFAEALAQWDQLPRKLAESLCGAWDLRHVETGAHVRRIGAYSELLASAVGMSSQEAMQLGHAALLHDIGKIAIPDTILSKPGRLTEQEFEVMKRHTVEGARLLSGVEHPLLQRAAEVALRHHERWDGSGYPDGLRGKACSLDARIVAVVDVYDALGHARCYKSAWSDERIATFFREGAGTMFEAKIVDALFDCLPRLKQLAEVWPEYDSATGLKAHPAVQPA